MAPPTIPSAADAADEQHRLLTADTMFARHAGQRGVNFR
jgi:hypothetical protein